MIKTIVSLIAGASLTLLAAQAVHARGFGGFHGGGFGGYHGGEFGGFHGGGYYGGYRGGGESYHGSYGGSAYRGPGGGTAYRGPGGNTAFHEPGYGTAFHSPGEGTAWHGADGVTGYSHARTTFPTDAGFGAAPSWGKVSAFTGIHLTTPVSGSVYAARGAAVRNTYNGTAFGHDWYGAHPGVWNPAAWTVGRAWAAATWPAVGAWCGWAAATQPVYYDYGNNVTYQGDQVYVDGQSTASADQYYQQAATLSQSQSAPDPNGDDWMPLGVFGLVKDAETDPHFIMQLAISKAGAIGGNYHDVISGTTLPIHGAVDKQTQRVAWTVGDNKTTVGETGLYNLTKNEAPVLIHMAKDKTQQWLLVRLKQPSNSDNQ
jgi:hypothetical protein